MTNKKFVQKIYRGAQSWRIPSRLIDPSTQYVIMSHGKNTISRTEAIGWGKNPKDAWADAVKRIKEDMLDKLTS